MECPRCGSADVDANAVCVTCGHELTRAELLAEATARPSVAVAEAPAPVKAKPPRGMQLCRSCHQPFGMFANTCPHCGQPTIAQAIGNVGKGMFHIGCAMLLLLIIIPLFLSC
jgi:hypothetical protein